MGQWAGGLVIQLVIRLVRLSIWTLVVCERWSIGDVWGGVGWEPEPPPVPSPAPSSCLSSGSGIEGTLSDSGGDEAQATPWPHAYLLEIAEAEANIEIEIENKGATGFPLKIENSEVRCCE